MKFVCITGSLYLYRNFQMTSILWLVNILIASPNLWQSFYFVSHSAPLPPNEYIWMNMTMYSDGLIKKRKKIDRNIEFLWGVWRCNRRVWYLSKKRDTASHPLHEVWIGIIVEINQQQCCAEAIIDVLNFNRGLKWLLTWQRWWLYLHLIWWWWSFWCG